jgi:hypothetical protein
MAIEAGKGRCSGMNLVPFMGCMTMLATENGFMKVIETLLSKRAYVIAE